MDVNRGKTAEATKAAAETAVIKNLGVFHFDAILDSRLERFDRFKDRIQSAGHGVQMDKLPFV